MPPAMAPELEDPKLHRQLHQQQQQQQQPPQLPLQHRRQPEEPQQKAHKLPLPHTPQLSHKLPASHKLQASHLPRSSQLLHHHHRSLAASHPQLPANPPRSTWLHAPAHTWHASLAQDGSSVSQAAAASKASDLETAELSHSAGRAEIVSKKLLGRFSASGLDGKFSRKKSVPSGNPSRVCRFCGRQFPSGRALGGHMRVHGALFAESQLAAAAMRMGADSKEQQQDRQLTTNVKKSSSHRTDEDFLIAYSNSSRQHHNSRAKKRRWSGSDFQGRTALHSKGSEEFPMGQVEEDDDARSERVSASSESDYDDGNLSSDDQCIEDRMIASSYRKEHSLGSLEFNSNPGLGPNDEFLDDEMGSSDSKKNPLYELRLNPKRNRRFTDQELNLDALAANTTIASGAKRSASESPERSRPCSECGKVFWSWKALFGHMRCHPERDWRGIQPPESSLELERGARIRKRSPAGHSFADNSELESDVENKELGLQREASFKVYVEEETSTMKGAGEATDKQETSNKIGVEEEKCIIRRSSEEHMLGEFTDDWTPHWPTGKRSKRRRARASRAFHSTSTAEPVLTSETTSDEFENQEDIDMANCLVMLSTTASRLDEQLETHRMESTEESSFSDSRTAHPRRPQESEHDLEGDEADLYEDFENERGTLDGAGAASNGVKYECSTCKRCFNSHQALGGHRASHRKTKGCFARTNLTEESGEENMTEEEFVSSELHKWQIQLSEPVEEERASILLSLDGGVAVSVKESGAASSKKKVKGHECSICHRVFPSGQALGGHKRCHWTGEKIADTTSVASSNSKQASLLSGGQTKKLKEDAIDLNLPAPVDEEDEAGYGSTEPASAYGTVVEFIKGEQMVAPAMQSKKEEIVSSEMVDAMMQSKDEEKVGCVVQSRDLQKVGMVQSQGEQMVGSVMHHLGSSSNLNGLAADWAVKDLLGGNANSSWRQQAGRELEARCRFDGVSSGIWGQQWPNRPAAPIPQICTLQSL